LDHLQYTNKVGEGLGDWVTCKDVRQIEVDTCGVMSGGNNIPGILGNEWCLVTCWLPVLGWTLQERTSRYFVGHHPLVCLHFITTSEMQPYFNILQYYSPPEKLILQSVMYCHN